MKRVIAILLVVVMVFALCACGTSIPNGTYVNTDTEFELKIVVKGDKAVIDLAGVASIPGTLSKENGKIYFTYNDGSSDEIKYNSRTETITKSGVPYTKR